VQLYRDSMRLRSMFVNILRQIDTQGNPPQFPGSCVSPALNKFTITPCDHAVGRVSTPYPVHQLQE
jgi:hypothetical protein